MYNTFTPSPSFREFAADDEQNFSSSIAGSPNWISAASEDWLQSMIAAEDGEQSNEFEFDLSADRSDDATADDFFPNGQILPVYPLFNRKLLFRDSVQLPMQELLKEERAVSSRSSSSSVEDLEGVLPGVFCLWEPGSVPPSPNRWKSHSTGSAWRRWRLRDLVFGRSHSDGKEKLGYLAAEDEKKVENRIPISKTGKGKGKEGKSAELDIVTAHRLYYSKNSGGGKRSFLPYKRDLVGFFSGGSGTSRTHHPM